VLLAGKYVNNDMPLIVANSDQVVEDFDIYDFINKGLDSDGHILCFEDPTRNPKWSYAAVENGFVTEVAEKKPISDFATVGIYFFKKGSDFVKYANQMINKDIRTNGEYYLCPVYNEFTGDGKKITVQLTENMHGLGTPSDLEAYIKVKNSI
jgi:dTDP-glucose pyrophosphorylase